MKKSKFVKLNRRSILSIGLTIAVLVVALYPLLQPKIATAAVAEGFIRFNRLETGAAITGTACLKSDQTSQTNVVIVFPNDWTISTTPANWTTTTTNLPVDPQGDTVTAWPSIGATATSVVGNSVVFTGGNFAASNVLYCFNFSGGTSAQSSLGAAGNDKVGTLKTQGGNPYTDEMEWATSVVSSGGDQITITASVSATMSFSLDSNTVALGTLSTSSITSGTAVTQEVSTNARNGWISWVRSANAALNSTIASDTILSPGTSNGAPESLTAQAGYVLDVNAGAGTPTINAEYNGGADEGGHLATTFQETATKITPGAADQAALVVKAKAGATTKAANDYTDTLTVVAAGSF